jgi:hypothetical protein
MVLRLKAWESRSPPGPPSREKSPQKTQATRTSRTYGNAASPGTGARAAPAKPPAKPPAEPNARTSSQRQSPQQKPQTRGRANKAPKPTPLPAGWSSPVARQAHNLKVAGSNPAPATKLLYNTRWLSAALRGGVCMSDRHVNTMSRKPMRRMVRIRRGPRLRRLDGTAIM